MAVVGRMIISHAQSLCNRRLCNCTDVRDRGWATWKTHNDCLNDQSDGNRRKSNYSPISILATQIAHSAVITQSLMSFLQPKSSQHIVGWSECQPDQMYHSLSTLILKTRIIQYVAKAERIKSKSKPNYVDNLSKPHNFSFSPNEWLDVIMSGG